MGRHTRRDAQNDRRGMHAQVANAVYEYVYAKLTNAVLARSACM